MAEDSIISYNLEDVADSDLEIESLVRKPDLVIEEFMVRTSHIKDEKNIRSKYLRKVWRVNHDTSERTLGVTSQRCAIIYKLSLARSYSKNDRTLRCKIIDEHFFM